MQKIPLWIGISGFCLILNSSLMAIEITTPSNETLKIDITGNPFATGEDLIILADGRKLRGVLQKLPEVQLPFGSLKDSIDKVILISIEKQGDRDILRVITKDGKEYIANLPNEKIQILLGNYKKEIDLSSIQFIVSHNFDASIFQQPIVEASTPALKPETEEVEEANKPTPLFNGDEICEFPQVEITSGMPISKMPVPLFSAETQLDIPTHANIAYFPVRIYCNEDLCVFANDISIRDIPTQLWDNSISLDTPEGITLKIEPLQILNGTSDFPENITLRMIPIQIFESEDVQAAIPENVTLSFWAIRGWDDELTSILVPTIKWESESSNTEYFADASLDIPENITLKNDPIQLFDSDDVKSALPEIATVNLWPVRGWDDSLTNCSAPIIELESFHIRAFSDDNAFDLPEQIAFISETPTHTTSTILEPTVENDIPKAIELQNFPYPLFCEFDLMTPHDIVINSLSFPIFTDDLIADLPTEITPTRLPPEYWTPPTNLDIPENIKVVSLPDSILTNKWAFGIPKNVTFIEYPQPFWADDASLEIPNEIAMRDMPPRYFLDQSANRPLLSTTKTWNEKISYWWNSLAQKEKKNDEVAIVDKVRTHAVDVRRVTNAEYREFVQATGHRYPIHWEEGAIPQGMENRPVANVSYYDAVQYAQWKRKRLPTASEWQQAATQGKLEGASDFFNEWVLTEADPQKRKFKEVIQGNTPNNAVRAEKDDYNSHTGFRCYE